MELAELLDSEGLDPDELLAWAHSRAEALVAELGDDEQSRPLLQLLERDASLDPKHDFGAVSVEARRPEPALEQPEDEPAASDDFEQPEPALAGFGEPEELESSDADAAIEDQVESAFDELGFDENESPTEDQPDQPEPALDQPEIEVPLDEPSSGPQPISADELPPPPETPRFADGEPEPMLETFDTGAIQLGTPEADELLARTSTSSPREPESEQLEPSSESESLAESEPAEASGDDESAEDDLDELDLDELVELDDEELVDLEDESEPPPPPPPSSGPPPLEAEAPVQTGDTAAHPVVEQDQPAGDDEDFDLDFD
jgi:hypothetical protein